MATKEFASKGVAGAGLGLGIAGTALGLLNGGGCGCGNGILGNILGGNCGCGNARMGAELQFVSGLQAENAMLKAENYSDKTSLEAYKQSVSDNKELRTEMYAFIKPLADEAAQNRVNIATLQAELKCCCEKQELREQILAGKINEVALATNGKFAALDQTIACLQNTVCGITKTIVPSSAICPQPMPLYNSWTAPTAAAPTNVQITNPVATTSGCAVAH